MSHHINLERIRVVANALKELKEAVVFVGGATISLYAFESTGMRPTDDVDVIVELATYKDYAALEELLRSFGFVNDQESGVICRYRIQDITVDIMPTVPDALGFSNIWYKEGFQNAIHYRIDEQLVIRIFSLPFFIASKIEAFKNRGQNDYRFSSDFEDIVYVLEKGENILKELNQAPESVRIYLQKEFRRMSSDPYFEEGVNAHLEWNTANQKMGKIDSLLEAFLK